MALGDRIFASPRLLDLAPNAGSPHRLEPSEPIGVELENLLDLAVRQHREQGETAGSDAQGPPVADVHRQCLYRIAAAHAVRADGLGPASDGKKGGVSRDF